MSGGHFGYKQYKIWEIADSIERLINDRYCYRHVYVDDGEFFHKSPCRTGYRWMCFSGLKLQLNPKKR